MRARLKLNGRSGKILRDGGVCNMVRIRFGLAVMLPVTLVAVIAAGHVSAQPPEKKPVVQSPLLSEPKTPEGMFAATLLMVELARLDLASAYLQQFLASAPDDELLIKLRDKYGTADFLKLAQIKELQPGSTVLLDQLNAAAKKQAEDPAFVDALIQRLLQGPGKRELAISELRNAGPRVVPELLKQMAKPELADQQDILVVTLVRMGRQVIPPLIGALDSPQERIQAAVIDALGWLNATEAIPYLWFPAFDENQSAGVHNIAKRTLAKLITGSERRAADLSSVEAANELRWLASLMYRHPDQMPVDEQGSIPLWGWDEKANELVLRSYSPEIASLLLSTRFARQSLALSPEEPNVQRQYLASLLGLEVSRDGWDKPRVAPPGSAMFLALTSGEETMTRVLTEALEAGHPATAVAALEVLSQIGTREQLLPQGGLKSPVIAALNFPEPRVQFAAATTILKLEPRAGFKGASRIVSILARAITDPGQPRVVIIDSDATRASETAGFVANGGYEGVVASSGRTGFEDAAKLSGVEIILVHVNVQRWDLRQTLANIRADARTAAIPLVLYGPATLRDELTRLVARNAPAAYLIDSATPDDFLSQLQPFVKNLKTPPLSAQERDLERKAAVYWLATIGNGSQSKLFDVSKAEKELSAVLEDPDVAINALSAMASIGNATAQERLADVALNPQGNLKLREVAANQLAYHIQHYGLLLTRDGVTSLHAGWAETTNPEVKSALATVIGSLKPNATIVGERLQRFPLPAAN